MPEAYLSDYEFLKLIAGGTNSPENLQLKFLFTTKDASFDNLGKETGETHLTREHQNTGEQAVTLVTSLGKPDKATSETFRKAGGAAAKWLVRSRVEHAALDIDILPLNDVDGALDALFEGLLLGAFHFTRHKSEKHDPIVPNITLLGGGSNIKAQVERISTVCAAANLARDWGHEPANMIDPESLTERIADLCRRSGLNLSVLDTSRLAELHAGGILDVGKGSQIPPRMLVIEYQGEGGSNPPAPVILVGKALTFDTGGYSLKDLTQIQGMKYDKSGGLVVLAVLLAAASLGIKQPLVGIIGAAENMISGGSYRPDDILTTMSGKTVEIITTDAEGRLVLADCLTYAQRRFSPAAMIDLATLTGGMVVALGRVRAGLFSNNDALAERLFKAGEHVYERLWRMPLDEEYLKNIRGDDADLKNSGGKEGHPVYGGVFLQEFVQNGVPWAHIDIAGVADANKEQPYCPKGSTGFGVRLLIQYLEAL